VSHLIRIAIAARLRKRLRRICDLHSDDKNPHHRKKFRANACARWIKVPAFLSRVRLPVSNASIRLGEGYMAKSDLDSMSIEELAALRDNANAKLLEKVAARQLELEVELDRLSQYGKPAKKALAAAPAAPVKPKKTTDKGEKKSDETNVSEAA
jgi:hypothetical protein